MYHTDNPKLKLYTAWVLCDRNGDFVERWTENLGLGLPCVTTLNLFNVEKKGDRKCVWDLNMLTNTEFLIYHIIPFVSLKRSLIFDKMDPKSGLMSPLCD